MKRWILIGLLATVPAHAMFYQVDDRFTFAAPFTYDFSVLGSPGTFVPNQNSETLNGVTLAIQTGAGGVQLARGSSAGFNNFASTDILAVQSDPRFGVVLRFYGGSVYGAGTQFEPTNIAYNVPYTAVLNVYDDQNNLLAEFSRVEVKTADPGSSVPFLGAVSTDTAISYLTLSFMPSGPPTRFTKDGTPILSEGDVTFNGPTVSATRIATDVPEPATLALLAAGLVSAGVIRRRRRPRPQRVSPLRRS